MASSQKQIYERRNNWLSYLSKLCNKWEEIGILEGLQNTYHQLMVGLCLENQRLINETEVYAHTQDGNNWVNLFGRISIPLVRRVYGNAPFTHWVGMQTKLSIDDYLWALEAGILAENVIRPKTRRLKTKWPLYNEEKAKTHHVRLDYEAEITEQVYLSISDEISREISDDIKNNCVHMQVEIESKSIIDVLERVGKSFIDSVGRSPNWVICSPSFIQANDGLTKPVIAGGVYHAGNLDYLQVYCDELFNDNELLFGYRGDWLDTGYYYMPYVPFTIAPMIINEDGSFPGYGMLSRYAKYMPIYGSRFYRLVEVHSAISTQEWNSVEEDGVFGLDLVVETQEGELDEDPQDQQLEYVRSGGLVQESDQQSELLISDGDDRLQN